MDSSPFHVDSGKSHGRNNHFQHEMYAATLETEAYSNHPRDDHSHISANRRHSPHSHVMALDSGSDADRAADFDSGFDSGLVRHTAVFPVMYISFCLQSNSNKLTR